MLRSGERHCHDYNNKQVVKVREQFWSCMWSKKQTKTILFGMVGNRKQTAICRVKMLCFVDPSVHIDSLDVAWHLLKWLRLTVLFLVMSQSQTNHFTITRKQDMLCARPLWPSVKNTMYPVSYKFKAYWFATTDMFSEKCNVTWITPVIKYPLVATKACLPFLWLCLCTNST